ncbi:nucleolar complex-associated protein 3 [Thozetella sp. PMI_491]|nr:nucleolar complex-associated protein 3 [Thozetella sp. PMI_491]
MATRPSKKRRLSPTTDAEQSGGNTSKIQKAYFKNAAGWNLEQDYELRRKKGKKKEKESNRLPIKTKDGQVRQLEAHHNDLASIASDEWLPSDEDDQVDEASRPAPEEPKIPEREQIRIAQEELAKVATQLNEDPEEHQGAFKALARIGESQVLAVQKLALLTQMTVYRDVIPGYRIRPTSEDLAGDKLSKDVRRLRQYEQALVSGYHNYLKTLAKFAAAGGPAVGKGGQNMPVIAITCACTLLNAVPHFNFRGDLLRILVRKLSARSVDDSFIKCRQALETMFAEDEEGRASMEAVSLLTKMMKARNYQVDESVLNLFLHLRLLSEFSGTASRDAVSQSNGKKKKKDREFRTKRERKLLKEQKAAEKVMAEADATVSHEERDQLQSETLKMVFATYFRILKQRSPNLMGAVLEGLARYAHLINQDFFGDLLEAMKDLIRHSDEPEEAADEQAGAENTEDSDTADSVRDTSREALLCTVTAFALLAGQDAHNARADLHLDLTFFTTHLYRSLLSLSVNPDLELGAKSLHLPDPDSPQESNRRSNKVNLQTTTVLLMRCLGGVMLPSWNIRSVPPARLAAFTKQLMATALHMPEKSSQAVLGLLQDVIHTHGKKVNALWNTEERKGDGTYNALSDSVEGSNPFAATVWEGEILKKHYCPKVREEVKLLEKNLAKIRD